MISNLISKTLYPMVPNVRRRWKQAAEIDLMHYWTKQRIKEFTDKALTTVLRNAAQRSRYYLNIFRERNWDPTCAEKYWEEWPILTQELLQKHRDSILSSDANMKMMYLDSSGGSSGKTKTFFHSREFSFHSACAAAYSDSIAGWVPGGKIAFLWGAPKDLGINAALESRLINILRNIRWYDSFNMSEDRMKQYHRSLSTFRPNVIIAYAGSIYQFARFLQRQGLRPSYPLQGIVASAETLTEEMRSAIMAVFSKQLFNRYGSREVGHIAFECQAHCGMHLSFSNNIVEVVKAGTTEPVCEEEGEILVTTINEMYFPLIRYQIGDVGILTKSECPCGRQSPRLAKVIGRTSDFISGFNGRKIHGEYFTHIFYGKKKIRQFIMVQEELDRITVQMVADPAPTQEERAEILQEFRLVLGEQTKINFEMVDRLSPLPSGKTRFTISRLEK